MNRTIATILTVGSALLCGIPSLFLCFMGTTTVLGASNPDFRAGFVEGSQGMSPDLILPYGLVMLAVSCALVIVPIVVGVVTFRMSKPQ